MKELQIDLIVFILSLKIINLNEILCWKILLIKSQQPRYKIILYDTWLESYWSELSEYQKTEHK